MKNGDQPINRGSNFPGLTKREHFAGLAMQGLLANPTMTGPSGRDNWDMETCFAEADELLAALSQPIDQPEEA